MSPGIENSAEDIDALVKIPDKIVSNTQASGHRDLASRQKGTPILAKEIVQQ